MGVYSVRGRWFCGGFVVVKANSTAPMGEPTAEDPQAETAESMGSVEKEEPEQLATRIWLFSNQDTAVGLMLQAMPVTGGSNDSHKDNPSEDISGFEHLSQLAQTLKPEEALSLDAETVLHRLFHQDPLRLYPAQSIEYQCGCSRQKSLASLTLVPRDELNDMLAETGKVTMNCEFCQTEYAFDSIDIEQIFANAGHDQQGTNPASH